MELLAVILDVALANTKLLLAIYTDPEYLYWSYRLKYVTGVLYELIDDFIYNELLNKTVNFKYLSDLIASWKPSDDIQTLKNRFVTRLIFQSYNILLQQQVQAYFDTYEDEKWAFALVGNFLSQRLQQSWESNSISSWASKWENRFKSTHDNSAGFKSVLQTFEQLLSDYPAFGEYLSLNKDVVDLSLEFKDYSEVKYVTQLTKDVLSNPDVSKKIAEYYDDYVNQIYNILYSSNVFAEMERYYETLADKLNENTDYQQLKDDNSIALEHLQYVQKRIHDYLYSCNLNESCIEIARDELLFGDEFKVKENIKAIGKFYERYNSFNYYFYNSAEYLSMESDAIEQVQNALDPVMDELEAAQNDYIQNIRNISQIKVLYEAMVDMVSILRDESAEFDQKLDTMATLAGALQEPGMLPTATTLTATNITANSASFNGTVNPNGTSTTVWFEYGTTSGSYTTKTSNLVISGTSTISIYANITGLIAGTKYYYRIVAQNNTGTSNGSEISFTTSSLLPPTATTLAATDVTGNTAKLNGTVNANGLSTTAWFEYGTTSGSYTDKTAEQAISGSSNTAASANLSGLTSGVKYYYRVAAKSSGGTVNGIEMSFTTLTVPPTVTTLAATDVTGNTAKLNGTVNANGLSTAAWFEYGTTSGSYTDKTAEQVISGSSNTAASANLSGLTSGVKYYYRVAAKSSGGTVNGIEMSFTTLTVPPTATTLAATDVTGNTAKLNGTVNANGLSTAAWFEYGTTSGSYTDKTAEQAISGSSNTAASANLSGLTSGVKYYYRVAAKSSGGTVNGIEMSFTTLTVPPTATTLAATDVTRNTAKLNGTVNANGLSTTAWFEYGTTSGLYTKKTAKQIISGSSDTAVGINIGNLLPNTQYYFRIVSRSDAGTTNGAEEFFSTSSVPPKVVTGLTQKVTDRSAILKGTVTPMGASTAVWFEYGKINNKLTDVTSTRVKNGTQKLPIKIGINGLTPGKKYFYRLIAQNSGGKSIGKKMYFKTKKTLRRITSKS